MRTAEERKQLLYRRVKTLKKNRELRLIKGFGSICAGLAIGLFAILGEATAVIRREMADSGFTGSAMLYENAGSYVLTAVAAFAAGTAITLLGRWYIGIGHRKIPAEDDAEDGEDG